MNDGVPVIKAAIDIGTVSTRLLIARLDQAGLHEMDRRTVVTHLGEGVASTAALAQRAIERTLVVLEQFRDACTAAGVDDVAVVATSATRDASNGETFLAGVRDLGFAPRVISGPEEASLSFHGATYSTRGDGVLVADLGGGSTELVVGSVSEDDGRVESQIEAARSVDVGSRRVTDMFLLSDPPTESELDEARAWTAEQFRPFFDGLRERPASMVALAGTATTLAAIRLGLAEYDSAQVHGSTLSGGDLADLREDLASRALADRREVPGLEPARAEVIVAGVLILEALLGLAGLDEMVVSEHDILYGLVLEGA